MAHATQRKCPERRLVNPELSNDGLPKPPQNKRRRLSTVINETESSTDSFSNSNFINSDSDESSDSDFEEHSYSRSQSKRLHHSKLRIKTKSNLSRPKLNHTSLIETDLKGNKRSRCLSKNAVMARLNRLKKKKYIEDLENKNAELEAENQMLKNLLEVRVKEVESLKKKTFNLKNVIKNSTVIGSLLKCVRQHTDLQITSSLLRSEPRPNCSSNTEVHTGKNSSNFNELEASPITKEALVAAVLWGMALHTFCQPYNVWPNFTESI